MEIQEDAVAIFQAGVARVDPRRLLASVARLEGSVLRLKGADAECAYDLAGFRHILVGGMGKASAVMAQEMEALLGSRIEDGFVVAKAIAGARCSRIRLAEAGHPVPDGRSVAAGAALLSLAARARSWESAGEPTLVILLISGGGSSLAAAPAAGLSLEDKAQVTKLLLGSGAPIQEMNAVRKHLSGIKGGRLAEAFAPATLVSLILSDVLGDDLDAIASGPAVPDSSTWEEARSILARRAVWDSLPAAARRIFEAGLAGSIPDTPKPGSSAFANARTLIVGNNMLALEAAEAEARARGYACLLLSSRLDGEARQVARLFHSIAEDIDIYSRPLSRPACVLAGGETTVILKGGGKGGRNQEMALAFLCLLTPRGKSGKTGSGSGSGSHDRAPSEGSQMVFLSAGTDGTDGPTDAAGAFASPALAEKAAALGLDARAYLEDNDSYTFFDSTGGLYKTGSTGTNVCDMQILLMR
ncbi:MAG TPA: DUF4147 domain-containing protein [Rectinemataceae bacterium]